MKNFIYNCKDKTKFLYARKSKDGCYYKEQYLGRVVRWYYSIDFKENIISGKKSKIADSQNGIPVNDLHTFNWDNVDYKKYLIDALKLRYMGSNRIINNVLNNKSDYNYGFLF